MDLYFRFTWSINLTHSNHYMYCTGGQALRASPTYDPTSQDVGTGEYSPSPQRTKKVETNELAHEDD